MTPQTIIPTSGELTADEERVARLPRGVSVTVRKGTGADLYIASGLLIGLIHSVDGPRIRLFGDDRVERQIPLPARITVR